MNDDRAINHFCASRIRPECLRIGADGTVRVGLVASPRAFFDAFSALGETLQLSRNSALIFGYLAPLPVLSNWSNPALPRNRSDSFRVNLAEIARVCATREMTPAGAVYGFELYHVDGSESQKILLTSDSRIDRFADFVERWQAPLESLHPWIPPNHVANSEQARFLRLRIPYLRYRAATLDPGVERLPDELPHYLLRALADSRMPFRLTFYSRSVIQSVEALSDACSSAEASPSQSVMGPNFSLHILGGPSGTVWFHGGQCPCCGKRPSTLEFGDAEDQLSLALSPLNIGEDERWRVMLARCLGQLGELK